MLGNSVQNFQELGNLIALAKTIIRLTNDSIYTKDVVQWITNQRSRVRATKHRKVKQKKTIYTSTGDNNT